MKSILIVLYKYMCLLAAKGGLCDSELRSSSRQIYYLYIYIYMKN